VIPLIIAELVTNFIDPRIGLILYGALLILLLLHAALRWQHPIHRLLLALTLVPLIRIVSLSLPLAELSFLSLYLAVSVPLLVSAVLIIRVLNFSRQEIGIKSGGLLIQALVSLTGLAFGYVEYLILKPEPLVRPSSVAQLWVPALILLLYTGFLEELIFRGLLQRAAADLLGNWSVLYVAVLFAVLHVGSNSVLHVIFVFDVGLFFGWIRAKTGNIIGISLSHGLTNIMLWVVLPSLMTRLI
jgi:hypothetical protein